MSTATTPLSPVEYVRALSGDDKGDVLVELLRELIEINGGGKCLIPIGTREGESLGYFVPPKAADAEAARDLPKLTPERERELADRLTRLHSAAPVTEVIAGLKPIIDRGDAARTQTPSSSGSP